MSGPRCECSHTRAQHRRAPQGTGECAHRPCGCMRYRPRAAAIAPVPPKVLPGTVAREPQAVAS